MPWPDEDAPRVLMIGLDLPHLGLAGSILLYRLLQNRPSESLRAVGPSVPANVQRLPCQFVAYAPSLCSLSSKRWPLVTPECGVEIGQSGIEIKDCRPEAIAKLISQVADCAS